VLLLLFLALCLQLFRDFIRFKLLIQQGLPLPLKALLNAQILTGF
jgi:hypothetical protein